MVQAIAAGGTIDSVVRKEETFEITGWALIDAQVPRGVLRLVLPDGVESSVEDAGRWRARTSSTRPATRP